MKKYRLSALLTIGFFLLVGCVATITKESLTQHDWVTIKKNEAEDVPLLLHFNNDKLIVKLDSDSFKEQLKESKKADSNESESVQKLLDDIQFDVSYSVENNKITLKSEILDIDGTFRLSKVKEDILLTPIGKKGAEVITLKPKK